MLLNWLIFYSCSPSYVPEKMTFRTMHKVFGSNQPKRKDIILSTVPSEDSGTLQEPEFATTTAMPTARAMHKRTPETAMIVRPRSRAERRFHHVGFLKKKLVNSYKNMSFVSHSKLNEAKTGLIRSKVLRFWIQFQEIRIINIVDGRFFSVNKFPFPFSILSFLPKEAFRVIQHFFHASAADSFQLPQQA